jgi:hypothetical protein
VTGARVAVVIPAFRVAAALPRVIAGLPPWVAHVVVVDDASPDDVPGAIAAAADPRVELVRRATNGGVGAAVKDGYRRALALGADLVVKMDGDDQMDPAELPRLLEPLCAGRADYTKGNRFRHARALDVMPPLRRAGNLGLSFGVKLASGYWSIFDPTNGYTAIRREVLAELDLDRTADRYFFEISMLVELNVVGAVVEDVPMPARYGEHPSSLSITRVLADFPPRLARALASRVGRKHVLHDLTAAAIFGLAGALGLGFGTTVGVHFWSRSIATGVPTTAGQVMLAGLPVLLGFQLLLQALVADMNAAPWPRNRPRLAPPWAGRPSAGG